MRTNRQKRWRAFAIGVALFAALALTACSDEQDNDSGQAATDGASISETASVTITKGTGGSPMSDTTMITDFVIVDVTGGAGSGSATADTTVITESVVTIKESPQSGGVGRGGGDHTFLQDSVTFVIRDSNGVVKNQGILN